MSTEQTTPTAIEQVISLLRDAREQSEKLLTNNSQNALQLAITFDLNKLINRLSFMSGTPIAHNQREVMDFPPVTNFMGEEIVRAEVITEEVLEPHEDAKKIYVDKVDALEQTLPTMSNEDILNAYTTVENVAVLRGVAKRASVEDYKEKELTVEFVEEIRSGLQLKATTAKTEKQIDTTATSGEAETILNKEQLVAGQPAAGATTAKTEDVLHKQEHVQKLKEQLKAEKNEEERLNKDLDKVKTEIASAKPKDKPALVAIETKLQADINACLERQLSIADELKPYVQE